MREAIADLHIHTVYSDGTLTPAEVVARAVANGVELLSICDHNAVEGSLATEPLARAAGLRFVRGVEIDSMFAGQDAHILCYGADFQHPELMHRIRDARHRLDDMSDRLLERMLADYPQLDAEEYAAMVFDSRLGGWKLLQYLMRKGVTHSLREGFPFYDRYGVTYASAGFRPAEEIVAAIHDAGGRAVLAHPGVTFGETKDGLYPTLEVAHNLGIDGIECFYPKHSPAFTEFLAAFCRERNLDITAGSDCHGAFGTADVGETRTPARTIRLTLRNS